MRRDPRVVVIGEDVSGGAGTEGGRDAAGGVLGVTKGLIKEFGEGRVIDTPITESAIMGAAAILTAFLSPHWPHAALFGIAILFGISAAGHLPVVLGEITRRAPPGQAGVLTSGANVFLIGGILVGPLAFGAVGAAFDYATAFFALGLCSLAGAFVLGHALLRLLPGAAADPGHTPRDRQGGGL